jgi:hypothetical protein
MPLLSPVRRLSLAAALALAASSPAVSAQVEVAGGVSATRDNETTPIATVSWLPEWRSFGAHGQLRWELGATHARGRSDSDYDNGDDVTVFHGGYRYERTDNGFTTGFGIGLQAGHTDALSGNPQFITTVGWRWGRFSVLARHISNASIKQPNDGETMLQAAWRF